MLLQFPVQKHQEGSDAHRQEEQHMPELCVTLLTLHHITDQTRWSLMLYSPFHSLSVHRNRQSMSQKFSLDSKVEREVHSEGTKLFLTFHLVHFSK